MSISQLILNLQKGRLLVSAESDLTWLSKFHNLSSPFHQLVGVPVYEDGAGCGHHGDGGLPVRERKSVGLSNIYCLQLLLHMYNVQHFNDFRCLTMPNCQLWEMSLTGYKPTKG